MIKHIDTVEINRDFIPAFLYNDYTCVDDAEMGAVESYADTLAGCILEVLADHYDLKRCVVTGLISETVTVKLWK